MHDAYMPGVGGSKSENVELCHTRLPVDEADLLEQAFRGAAASRRSALDLLRGGGDCPPLKAKIEGELKKISERAVQILSLSLIPHYANAETTVVFMKMLADHHRYLAEITHDDATRQATETARLAYRDAADTARTSLPRHSNIRRGMQIQRYRHGLRRSRSRSPDA